MVTCSICLEEINSLHTIKKWKCDHQFHPSCILNWHDTCPNCRAERIEKSYFDIPYFRSFARKLCSSEYIEQWDKKTCIDNHDLQFHKSYGVLGTCLTCYTIQSFNYINGT